MRSSRLGAVLGVLVLGVLAAAPSARADTMFLRNGDFLLGELQQADIPVVTRDGMVRVGSREVRQVTLSSISGDVLALRRGGELSGTVDQATFAIRLASGQTVVVGRHHVFAILLQSR